MKKAPRRRQRGVSGIIAALILASIVTSTIAGYFVTTQQFTSSYQAAAAEVAARNRQIAMEQFRVAGQANVTGLFVDVSNSGPLPIRVVGIFVNESLTANLTATPAAVNTEGRKTLATGFSYTSGIVTIRVLSERGNLATELFPSAAGPNSVVIAAFDQILNTNVNLVFTVGGEADGVTYPPGTPFNTGLTGRVFNDVVSLTVTMPDPAGTSPFRRWADGIGANPRTFTEAGTYAALYGDPIAGFAAVAGGIGVWSLHFDAYCRYTVVATLTGGAVGYQAPNGPVYFSVTVTNKDLQKRTVTLSSQTELWMIQPGSSSTDDWDVVAYRKPGSASGCPNGLTTTPFPTAGVPVAYDERITLYFGPSDPPGSFTGKVAAVFLMFYGLIGGNPYAQNIPFVGTEWF